VSAFDTNWLDADKYCQKVEQAALVEIQTEEQFEFLKEAAAMVDNALGDHFWWV